MSQVILKNQVIEKKKEEEYEYEYEEENKNQDKREKPLLSFTTKHPINVLTAKL